MIEKITWRHADGHIVTDTDRKEYIDFTSGIFAANLGHNNTAVSEAIKTQADKFCHCYDYPTEIRDKYEAALCEYTGFEAVALFSSGTEATEAALRVMRRWGRQTRKRKIWKIKGGFHGRTIGTQDNGPGIVTLDFPDKASGYFCPDPGRCLGVILEPYRATDAQFFQKEWIDALFELKNYYKFLICFDEIQAGFWRTGKMFGYQHYGVEPDLVCIGKGMANGFPVSGLLARKKEYLEGVPLSSTNGGNPLACAAGLATLSEYKNYFYYNAWFLRNCAFFKEQIKTLPVRSNVRGMVAGLCFDSTEQADRICAECQERGLLVVHTGGSTIKLGPPLTITADAITKGSEILKGVIHDCNA